MVLHIKDEETDWMVRDFAKRRGIGITAAIKIAVVEATQIEKNAADELSDRLEPIVEEIRRRRVDVSFNQKVFADDLWGEDT